MHKINFLLKVFSATETLILWRNQFLKNPEVFWNLYEEKNLKIFFFSHPILNTGLGQDCFKTNLSFLLRLLEKDKTRRPPSVYDKSELQIFQASDHHMLWDKIKLPHVWFDVTEIS